MKRAYVEDETHEKVKVYATRRSITLTEAYEKLVDKLLDERAEEREPFMESEDYEVLKETAKSMEMTAAELVKYSLSTVKMLFSDDLVFSDVIKPLPEIWETLEEKRGGKGEVRTVPEKGELGGD